MKKLTAFLVAILIIKNISAQISDGDARLAYQQINDAYENTSYFSASQMSADLKQKMGKWTPRVMYMYLQCVFKNYTEATQNGGIRYPVDYKKFCSFKSQADTFFTLVDKSSYPQDKYNNMVTAQKYFSDMMAKYKYQEDRTPESAVAFLNECARKYTNPHVGGQPDIKNTSNVVYTNENSGDYFDRTLRFTLRDGYLFVTIVNKWRYKVDRKNTFAVINNDVIDLHSGQPTNAQTNYVKSYIYHNLYIYKNRDDLPKQDSMLPMKVLVQNTDKFRYACVRGSNERIDSFNVAATYLRFPVLDLFSRTSDFYAGRYDDRILEAFNFLLNYYPALPVNNAPKEETNRPLGF